MLLVLFKIDNYEYGLSTDLVVEIIPALDVRAMPGTPDCVTGVIDYRGSIVPVIDVTKLTVNKSSKKRLSTRIMLINFAHKKGTALIGLMAEGMTDTFEAKEDDLLDSGIRPKDAPHLGKMVKRGEEFIQCIEFERLLPDEVKDKIFSNKALSGNHENTR